MASALRYAPRRALLALPLTLCLGLALGACEQDAKPKAEKAKLEAPPPGIGPLATNAAPAGACADEPSGSCNGACNGNCGEHKAAENGCGTESCGCGMAGKDNGNAAGIVPITEAKVGDKTRCPVSHGVFVVRENSPKLEHDGKTYYFCCPGCVNRFMQNPEKFVQI